MIPNFPLTENLPMVVCQRLAELAIAMDGATDWPREQLALCAQHGVLAWFVDPSYGGLGFSHRQITQGLLQIAEACQTTAFVLTQLAAAIRRIGACDSIEQKANWLPLLASGTKFATVGISHLTTSRRHLGTPVLSATRTDSGYILRGYSPWVTGASEVDLLVVGAEVPPHNQILVLIPSSAPGVVCEQPERLIALSGSRTSRVLFHDVTVPWSSVLSGPAETILVPGAGGQTGGLQTSTLALGLARAACAYLEREQQRRPHLEVPSRSLRLECDALVEQLLWLADGNAGSLEELRARSNSLVLRATQAALASAKGTGYILGHPTGRWCREALFFLVWSCPQAVIEANLCELAGLED